MAEVDLKRQITLDAIIRDARYVGHYIGSSRGSSPTCSLAPIAHLFMYGHFSAFVHESREKWGYVRQDQASTLSPAVIEIIKKSRNSLKYLEDDNLDASQIIKDFDTKVIGPARADYLPRFGTDLGIFRYDGKIYSTTHSATFGLGIPFDQLTSAYIRGVSTDYGRYFAKWGAKLEDTRSFLNHLDDGLVGQEENHKSEDFYAQIYNDSGPDSLNAFATLLHGAVNFSNLLLAADPLEDCFQTTFKLRYLTLYHAVRSIQALIGLRHPDISFSSSSKTHMKRILSLPLAKQIVKNESNPSALRRSLIHYSPEDRLMDTLRLSQPLYGLIGAAFPNSTFDDSVDLIYTSSVTVADIFAEWQGATTESLSTS